MGGLVSSIFGGGGGGGSQNTTQTVSNEPPSYLLPYLGDLAVRGSGAMRSLDSSGFKAAYAGPRTAGITPEDQMAQAMAKGTSADVANNIAPASRTNFNNFLATLNPQANGQNQYLQPSTMQFQPQTDEQLTNAINSKLIPITRNLNENTMPMLKDNAIASGAYGGTADKTVQEHAVRDYNDSANNIAGQMLYANEQANNQMKYGDFQNQRNAALQGNQQAMAAAQLVPQLGSAVEQQQLDASNIIGNIGAQNRGFTTADISAAMQQHTDDQNQFFTGLPQYGATLGQSYTGGMQTTAVPSSGFGNFAAGALGLNNALGLVGSGGSMYNTNTLPSSFMGPPTAAQSPGLLQQGFNFLSSLF